MTALGQSFVFATKVIAVSAVICALRASRMWTKMGYASQPVQHQVLIAATALAPMKAELLPVNAKNVGVDLIARAAQPVLRQSVMRMGELSTAFWIAKPGVWPAPTALAL